MTFLLIFLGMGLIVLSAYVSIKCHRDKERLSLWLWSCGAGLVMLGSVLYIATY